ncbi:hypothetical protein ACQR1N_07380 [Bradyrhizobium sp. HKCCYLRH1073]|uniref:hypothetical protein n=1 Tax=unclassified Bradyrhizobium TaxID=2631580 RepID=UPI003EBBE290
MTKVLYKFRRSVAICARWSGTTVALSLRGARGIPLTVARVTRQHHRKRGISIGMPGPRLGCAPQDLRQHDRITSHPAPDGRETPLVCGGTDEEKHDFQKEKEEYFGLGAGKGKSD